MTETYLRRYRTQANLRQEELAELTGISRVTISKIESGTGASRKQTRRKLAQALAGVLGWDDLHTAKAAVRLSAMCPPEKSTGSVSQPERLLVEPLPSAYEPTTDDREVAGDILRLGAAARHLLWGRPSIFGMGSYPEDELPAARLEALAEFAGISSQRLFLSLIETSLRSFRRSPYMTGIENLLRAIDHQDSRSVDAVRHAFAGESTPVSQTAVRSWMIDVENTAWRIWSAYCPGEMPMHAPDALELPTEQRAEDNSQAFADMQTKPYSVRLIGISGYWSRKYFESLTLEPNTYFRGSSLMEPIEEELLGPSHRLMGPVRYGKSSLGHPVVVEDCRGDGDKLWVRIPWPKKSGDLPENIDHLNIVADEADGAASVFIAHGTEIISLLPKASGPESEWNFGYRGSGPGTLTEDIVTFLSAQGLPHSREYIYQTLTDENLEELNIPISSLTGGEE